MLNGYDSDSEKSDNDDLACNTGSDNDSSDSGSNSDTNSSSGEEPEVESISQSSLAAKPWEPSSIGPGEDRRQFLACRYFVQGNCKNSDKCPYKHTSVSITPAHKSTTYMQVVITINCLGLLGDLESKYTQK